MHLLSPRAVIVSILCAGSLPAGDWPQWRGPNRDGVWNETGVLESFPPEGLKVLWRATIGVGYSSPVVAGGCVYVTDSELVRPKARERVHAFEEATGKPCWTHSYEVDYPDWAFDEKNAYGPTATPIAHDGKVFTAGGLGLLSCLEALKGGVIWKRDLAKEYPGKDLQCRASPLIEGDLFIVFAGARPGAGVIAFDKSNGREAWKALDEPPTPSSPIIIKAGGERQLIIWTDEAVTSLDPATGKVYWRQRLNATAEYVVSTPVFHEDRLLLGGLMLKLDPATPAASVLWPEKSTVSRRILSNTSTALFRSEHVYSAKSSGELVCLEAGTGKQLWETSKVTDIGNGASVHIVANGDSALLFNDRGELIRARLTPAGYQELGRAALIEPTYPFGPRKRAWTAPAFAHRRAFARNDKELICRSLAAGL